MVMAKEEFMECTGNIGETSRKTIVAVFDLRSDTERERD
jgi:hypothetical protein